MKCTVACGKTWFARSCCCLLATNSRYSMHAKKQANPVLALLEYEKAKFDCCRGDHQDYVLFVYFESCPGLARTAPPLGLERA